MKIDLSCPSEFWRCRLIDKEILPGYGCMSVYGMTDLQKSQVYRLLRNDFHLPDRQIRRCLVYR